MTVSSGMLVSEIGRAVATVGNDRAAATVATAASEEMRGVVDMTTMLLGRVQPDHRRAAVNPIGDE